MKKLVILVCLLSGGCLCRSLFSKDSTVHFSVRDEEGNPITNAVAHVSTIIDWKPGSEFGKSTYKRYDGNVDTNGNVSVSFYTYDLNVDCWVSAEGFYTSTFKTGSFRMKDDFILGIYVVNQLEFEKSFEFTLRRKMNPSPMYRCHYDYLRKVSSPEILHGFDMLENDWVAPQGKGKVADFSVQFGYYEKSDTTNKWIHSVKLIFPHPMDGAYLENYNTSSKYKTVYHADTNRVFQSVISCKGVNFEDSYFGFFLQKCG